MDTIFQIINSIIAAVEASKYVLFFISSYLEGSAVIILGGFLVHSGAVSLWPTFIALYVGDMLSDITLYTIGYWGAHGIVNRWGHYFGLTHEIIEKMEGRFKRYHTRILIISKLTMGFGFAYATLVTAGIMRVPFFRFVTINALGGIIWLSFLMTIGYFFGDALQYMSIPLKLVFVTVMITAMILLVRYIQKQLKAL